MMELTEDVTESPNCWASAREQATIIASASNPGFRKWEKPFTSKISQAYITGRVQKFCGFSNLLCQIGASHLTFLLPFQRICLMKPLRPVLVLASLLQFNMARAEVPGGGSGLHRERRQKTLAALAAIPRHSDCQSIGLLAQAGYRQMKLGIGFCHKKLVIFWTIC
jgi:hypothetical protein